MDLADRLRDGLTRRGAALAGFADVAGVPENMRPGLPRAVSFARALDPAIIDGIKDGPTPEYYRLYERVNAELDEWGESIAAFLREEGHRAQAVVASSGKGGIDMETLSAGFSHKMAATRAGLGWIGKCALCITPEYGSAVRFATVLTDAPLPVGTPITESRCGECRNCVDVCPGDAPSGANWDASKHRDDFFGALDCLRGILSHETDYGYICGMCIRACPYTQRYLEREGALFSEPKG